MKKSPSMGGSPGVEEGMPCQREQKDKLNSYDFRVVGQKKKKNHQIWPHRSFPYLVRTTGQDRAAGCTAWGHSVLLRLCPKLQSTQSNFSFVLRADPPAPLPSQRLTRPTLLRSKRLKGLLTAASVWMKFLSMSVDVVCT